MTLAKAHRIVEISVDAFASKPTTNFCPRSALRGHSFAEISKAFSLVIAARRQIAEEDADLRKSCDEFAKLAAGHVAWLDQMVVSDASFDRLSRIPIDSPERKRALVDAHIASRAENQKQSDELGQAETQESFHRFCCSLDHRDPLFWQKVYTRLGLPYDESSPIGQPATEPSDGRATFFFPNEVFKYSFETRDQSKANCRVVTLLLAVVIVWLCLYYFANR
jgi:hypothetical protein